MSTSRLKALLLKYLSSPLTFEEYEEFQLLISKVDQETLCNIYNELDIEDPFLGEMDYDFDVVGVFHNIQKEIRHSGVSYRKYYALGIAIASAILLFIFFKVLISSHTLHWNRSNLLKVSNEIPLLDSTGVRLRLADGQIINLKDIDSQKLLDNNLFGISIKQGSIHCQLQKQSIAPTVTGNHIFFTDRGAMSSIVLEDGTVVWLNSASSLKFPNSFTDQDTRTVEIDGEAYFDVAHNKNKPFIVKVRNSKIIVLGTKFNIRAYPEENAQTTLVQGSVLISGLNEKQTIFPGDQAIIGETGQIQIRQVNVEDYTLWKSGVVQFNSLTVDEVINELRRWYDIQSVENFSKNKETYTGSLNKNKDLSKMLEQLEYISNTKINIKERRIVIID